MHKSASALEDQMSSPNLNKLRRSAALILFIFNVEIVMIEWFKFFTCMLLIWKEINNYSLPVLNWGTVD